MHPRSRWRPEAVAPLLAALTLAPGAFSQEADDPPTPPPLPADPPPAEPVPDPPPVPQAPDNRSCRAHYVIRARVESAATDGDTATPQDPQPQRLEGQLTLTWENRTADTVGDLWFHLHLNAYSNNLTTHLWESEGKLRRMEKELTEGWSWQRVTSIRQGETELLDTLTYQRPDDGRDDDHSVFSIQLPEPVPPGGVATIDITWESRLPRVRRRTGVKGDFILLAHWFPKLGVYEAGRGWNCHQFHMNTEFYADYGNYDVTLDLPKAYVDKVGASGVQVEASATGDRYTVRFLAPSSGDREYVDPVASGYEDPRPLVHGFAWTADPDFVRHERTFDFDEWRGRILADGRTAAEEVNLVEDALGMGRGTLKLRDVKVIVLMQPERDGQWERHYEATCTALFFYGLWFGEYPYEQVTVVDPAWGARGAGGMEYPTLFTCGTRLFTEPEMYTPESVTVHECGHQFWYALVGNNEYENAWLDEGFNSYTDSEALVRRYGKQRSSTSYSGLPVWGVPVAAEPGDRGLAGILTGQRWSFSKWELVLAPLAPSPFVDWWRDQPWLTFGEDHQDPRWGDRQGYLRVPDVDPVRTDGWRYLDRESYRTNSYPRPAVVLRSLPGVVGQQAFIRGMRHYAGQWRYRHPYPTDFYTAFNEGASHDVTWYFEELFEGTGTVDWSINVAQRRSPLPRGYFLKDDGYQEVVPPKEGDEDIPGDGLAGSTTQGSDDPDEPQPWLYDVVVRRKGTLRLPVTIEVTFKADGPEATEEILSFEWTREMQAGSNWWRLPIPSGPREIQRVVVDPQRLYYLDANMSDNQWYAERDPVAPVRWSERAFTQYVHLLHWFSSLGG